MIDLKEEQTDPYKKAIAAYLAERCEKDEALREACKKENKTLDGCIKYVRDEAQKRKSGNVAVISDAEVYDMCVHYILEDELDSEPTEAEKAEIERNRPVPRVDYDKLKKQLDEALSEIEDLKKGGQPRTENEPDGKLENEMNVLKANIESLEKALAEKDGEIEKLRGELRRMDGELEKSKNETKQAAKAVVSETMPLFAGLFE